MNVGYLFATRGAAAFTLACSATATAWADYPATLLSQAPIGYWRLNETAQPPSPSPAVNVGALGSSVDGQYLSGPRLGEPGALANSSAASARFFNPTLDPSFSGSKVDVPYDDRLNPQPPFSIEFWAKPSLVVTDVFCLVSSLDSDPGIGLSTNSDPRAGWLFYLNGSDTNATANQWQFRLGNADHYQDGDAIRGGTAAVGVWHHVVGTFDGSTAMLYVNGTRVASGPVSGYEPNQARPFRIAGTSFDTPLAPPGTFAGNRGFDGWVEEVAFYDTVLNAADISAHYNAGRSNGNTYPSLVLAKRPLGLWRLGEAGNPPAANLGTLGAAANGQYVYSCQPGQPGPQPPAYGGLETGNRSCAFDGSGGAVDLPPLNLNTNTVTITAWIRADTVQSNNTGLVFCHAGTTVAGLKFDVNDPNGLSYNWNADIAAAQFKSSLTVPVSQWCFVGLIVQPDQATLCLQDGADFNTAINYAVHPEQAFEGDTLIGTDNQDPSLTFNGRIDEVAIFNRALSVGEVFSEYAAAVGGVKPAFFTDLQSPVQTIYAGDTITLSVDAGGTPPLSYVWRKDGQAIPGASSTTFTLTNTVLADSGAYDVLVSNAQGSIISQPSAITVQPLASPAISQDPQGRTLYRGGLLDLTVQASGGGLTYQWQKNGANIPGATNAIYRVANATGSDSGSYQVIVSNQVGATPSASASVTIVVPGANSYEDLVLSDGPESWWRLDDSPGSTTVVDAMGRHDGVYHGGVSLGAPGVLVGETNAAATFDGSSAYAEVPFSKALNTSNYTIECWVKADVVPQGLCPLASFTQPPGRGYVLEKSADGQWLYGFGDGVDPRVTFAPGSDANYAAWTHLAVTFDGVTYTGYLNGTIDVAGDPGPIMPNNIAPLRIGFDQTGQGWNDYWSGQIDEVAYYQKALSADKIAAHYAAALYGPQTKPVFTQQPPSARAVVGSLFFFAPLVAGTVPIQLQWIRNGLPLSGETNSLLVLANLAYSDSGVYQLAASNRVGSALSDPATLAVLPPPAFANATNELVLHLPFDRSYVDTSGRGHDAQAVGPTAFVAGLIGNGSLHCSTTVDTSNVNNPVVKTAAYATLGTPTDLQFSSNVNFSVSFWVRFTGTPGDLPFLCNSINALGYAGYTFAPSYQLGGWAWSLGDAATANSIQTYGADNSINDGLWHHLAHTLNRAGSAITYLDGAEVDSRSIVPAGDLDSGNPITIGQDASGAYPEAAAFDIDDLGIWRRVLDPFEVYAIYSVGQSGKSFDTYGPVSLAVTLDAGTVQLVWQAGTLFAADDPSGPWSAVTGASPPYYKLNPTATRKFYRVQL